ncbi:MAG: hypothetical protein HRT70_06900 [Flavobacteriaceae bacterium]|nr:hypothetical protein [Flavobacteriaceae bacterium]
MATTGRFNGTNLLVLVDGKPIGHTTSCTLDLQHNLAEASSKDSGGFSEVISAMRSATISFEGLVDYGDDGTTKEGVDSLIADGVISRTEFTLVFGTQETGDTVYTMNGFLASISITAPAEETVTYSGSFTSTGAITASVN